METRSCYVVKERYGDLQNNFKALFDEVSTAGDSVNGVIYVANHQYQIKITKSTN